jgi:hypothetical protein
MRILAGEGMLKTKHICQDRLGTHIPVRLQLSTKMTFSRTQANLGQNITDARATVAAFREDIKVRKNAFLRHFIYSK